MKKKKKRRSPAAKRRILALRIILGAVALAAVIVVVWQWNNIGAFIDSRRYSSADLEKMLSQNEKDTEAILERLPYVTLRPLTDDEKAQLRNGELTEDEVVERILSLAVPGSGGPSAGVDTAPDPGANTDAAGTPAASPVPSPSAPGDEKTERIAALVARVYVLRESMTGQLEGIVNAAKAEYNALPGEQRTGAKKGEFATRCLRQAAALERQSDATVDTILKEMETLLKETGGDTGLVGEIRQAYANEKALKKSYFINQYS
jgi:hypothetical protein